MNTESQVHQVCAQRRRRLRVLVVAGFVNLAVLGLTYMCDSRDGLMISAVAAGVFGVATLTFAFLLHFRCPARVRGGAR